MLGYFPDTITGVKIIERSQRQHLERLKDIRRTPSKRIDNRRPTKVSITPVLESKVEKSKLGRIHQENEKMMKKIEKIVNRTPGEANSIDKIRTLNYTSRKMMQKKIKEENKLFKSRIVSSRSQISTKEILNDTRKLAMGMVTRKHYLNVPGNTWYK